MNKVDVSQVLPFLNVGWISARQIAKALDVPIKKVVPILVGLRRAGDVERKQIRGYGLWRLRTK